jgi:hypothetical protein
VSVPGVLDELSTNVGCIDFYGTQMLFATSTVFFCYIDMLEMLQKIATCHKFLRIVLQNDTTFLENTTYTQKMLGLRFSSRKIIHLPWVIHALHPLGAQPFNGTNRVGHFHWPHVPPGPNKISSLALSSPPICTFSTDHSLLSLPLGHAPPQLSLTRLPRATLPPGAIGGAMKRDQVRIPWMASSTPLPPPHRPRGSLVPPP